MTRDEKLVEVLSSALLVFPVFKVNNQIDNEKPKLTHLQFITMLFIAHSPRPDGEPMNSISSFLGISKQQTTKLIDSLDLMGFVRRSWNPNSRREILINIKDEGRSVLREIKECREEAFINRLKYLSDSEVDELYLHIKAAYELFKKANY